MKSSLKAFAGLVSGSSSDLVFGMKKELSGLFSDKDRGFDPNSLSDAQRIEVERRDLVKRYQKAETLGNPGLFKESEKTGSKRLSFLNQPALSVVTEHLIDYPAPTNINYFWSFGSLAGICLVVQIATGIFLAMHYTPHVDLAFLD